MTNFFYLSSPSAAISCPLPTENEIRSSLPALLAQYTPYHLMLSFSSCSMFQIYRSSVSLPTLRPPLAYFFFSLNANTSFFYPAGDVFPIKTNFLFSPILTAFHLPASELTPLHPRARRCPACAHERVSTFQSTFSASLSRKIHIHVPSMLRRFSYLPPAPSSHNKP